MRLSRGCTVAAGSLVFCSAHVGGKHTEKAGTFGGHADVSSEEIRRRFSTQCVEDEDDVDRFEGFEERLAVAPDVGYEAVANQDELSALVDPVPDVLSVGVKSLPSAKLRRQDARAPS